MVQAEQSVIGCLMMAPELLDKARAVLSPAMFEAQPLARIFSCMLELKKAGTPVDAVTVVSRLGDGYEAVRPTITTTTDKAITLSAPESVEDSSVTLAVRQISYFNYKVDDIDKRQAVGGVMEALNKEATYGLADEMDKHIAGMAATREAVKYAASATAITKDNVLGEIDKALEKLYGNNVRPNGKIMMEVPPWFYMRLKQAYTALDTDNSKMLENGRVGKYGNVIVKMSKGRWSQ